VAIFIIASITDFFDGRIARKQGLITNFGKFMDPLADKLLVCAALICMAGTMIPKWVVIIIISRELFISGFRAIAADQNVVLAASMWGKVKTTVQMIMIIVLLVNLPWKFFEIVGIILIYASMALAIISMIDYVVKNIQVLKK
jgi:CDP-diacylglycerol--glycerol-3-phosphate 3-phosphatidyltransferase